MIDDTTPALFVADEQGRYHPTRYAVGPWDPRLLHGGATGGLVAHVLEAADPAPALQFVRLCIDLLRPVPLAPLTATARVVRSGARLCVMEAELRHEDKIVVKAQALKLMPDPVTVPEHARPDRPLPADPETIPVTDLMGRRLPELAQRRPSMHHCIEAKRVHGFALRGEGAAWLRCAVPVVHGALLSPFARVATLADFGNGLAQLQVDSRTGCINADISLHLLRPPSAEWICLDARAELFDHGLGAVHTALFDPVGYIGRVTQTLLTRHMGR
ncbi:MAG: thioesterase family protein [Pseudomonadota bacterium]